MGFSPVLLCFSGFFQFFHVSGTSSHFLETIISISSSQDLLVSWQLLLLFGSVHLSMPGHDYVKLGRLAVTDKTKPIYI